METVGTDFDFFAFVEYIASVSVCHICILFCTKIRNDQKPRSVLTFRIEPFPFFNQEFIRKLLSLSSIFHVGALTTQLNRTKQTTASFL